MEDFISYIESWEFWFRIVWYSSALGFGLALGFNLFESVNEVLKRILNLKFKNKE